MGPVLVVNVGVWRYDAAYGSEPIHVWSAWEAACWLSWEPRWQELFWDDIVAFGPFDELLGWLEQAHAAGEAPVLARVRLRAFDVPLAEAYRARLGALGYRVLPVEPLTPDPPLSAEEELRAVFWHRDEVREPHRTCARHLAHAARLASRALAPTPAEAAWWQAQSPADYERRQRLPRDLARELVSGAQRRRPPRHRRELV